MSSLNQSNMNDSRNTSRLSGLFSNRTLDDSMASRQSRENSLISTNRYKSPFYEGKVSFGGLSAKRLRLSKITPYNLADKPSSITRIKDSDIKRLNDFEQLSNATKSVFEKICKASSPIEDAKRIPTFSNQPTDKYMIDMNNKPFKRLSSTRSPFTVPSFKITSPMDREKLQLRWEELEHSSSQSLNNSLQNINNQNYLIANASGSQFHQQQRLSTSAIDQSSPAILGTGSAAGGKMRAKITRTNRTSKWSEDEYQPPEYDLPKNVSLPINSNSLPKFNLNKKSMQPQQSKSNIVNRSSLKRSLVSVTQEDDSWDAWDEFKFSAPKAIKLEKISDSFLKDSIRKEIVEPIEPAKSSAVEKSNPVEKRPSTTQATNLTISQPPSSPIKPSTDGLNLETNKTVGMFTVDKLDNDFNPKENKATLANTNLVPIKSAADIKLSNTFNYDGLNEFAKSNFLSNAKKWNCDTCDLRNELSATECAACNQPRLKEAKDKNVNKIYCNYSFNTINLEKKDFNAFKLDSTKTTQPSVSSISTTVSSSSSFLSNALSTKTITFTTTSVSNSDLLTNSNTSNSNKIESNAITDKPTLPDKTQSNSESTTLTTTFNTTNKPTAIESGKPFNFITNEVADQIEKDKQSVKSSTNSWGTQFLPPKGNWQCPGCFASNQSTHAKCPCCEEPNPNQPKESKDVKTDAKPALSFTTQSTDGFKFNIPPTTSSSTTTAANFNFTNKLNTISKEGEQAKGFSFASLVPSVTNVSKTDNQIQSSSLFSFGKTDTNLAPTIPTTTTIGTTSKPLINLGESIKQTTTSQNDSNKSSNFSASSSVLPFNFGAPAKDSNNSSTVIKTEQQSINKPSFSFGNPIASSNPPVASNNGGITFGLPNQTANQPTGLFSLPSANASNVSSNNSISNFNSFGNQFGNKAQFGLPSMNNTASSTNIFSPPTNQLSNGFGAPTTDNNNLFSTPAAATVQTTNNPAPPVNFSFNQVPSFAFGSTDQTQNNNSVFQFQANPRTDAPLVQPPLITNHGRCIKKAKRRLGSKD